MTNRTRSSGTFTNTNHSANWYSTSRVGGCSQPMTRTDRGPFAVDEVVGDRRTMSDVVTPGFRGRQARGEIIMSPMNQRIMTINPATFGSNLSFYANAYQCTGASQFRTIYELPYFWPLYGMPNYFGISQAGDWSPSQLLSNGEVEGALDEASTRCHAERGDSQLNLWESIAERKQTYALLASYADELRTTSKRMVDGFSRTRYIDKALYRTTKAATVGAAGLYLLTRYGVLPLINDVRGLMEAMKKDVDDATRHTTRATAQVGTSSSTSSSVLQEDSIYESRNLLLTDEVTVRAMSLDEWKVTTADHFGLGYKGLVTLPWDLTTLSFVADWFVNVSDWIKAVTPTPHITQLGSCLVLTRTQSLTYTVSGYSGHGVGAVIAPATCMKTGTHVSKTRFPGLRSPTLVRLNRSKIDPELNRNMWRIVDSFALVAQRLSSVDVALRRMLKQ